MCHMFSKMPLGLRKEKTLLVPGFWPSLRYKLGTKWFSPVMAWAQQGTCKGMQQLSKVCRCTILD